MKPLQLFQRSVWLLMLFLPARANAQFLGPHLLPPANGLKQELSRVYFADLDGDGLDDQLTALKTYFPASTASRYAVQWQHNDGAGHFGAPQALLFDYALLADNLTDLWTADLSGNGAADLVYRNGSVLLWRPNDGAGHFAPPATIVEADCLVAAFGDIDNDGDTDILAYEPVFLNLFWIENTGASTDWPTHPQQSVTCCPAEYHLADLNGDGRLDILLDLYDNWLYWMPNLGGSFDSPQALIYNSGNEYFFYPADREGDGDTDLLRHNVYAYSDQLEWLVNDGTAVFTPAPAVFTGTADAYIDGANGLAVADLTGDNLPDILARTRLNGLKRWSIWVNQGGGDFVRTDGAETLPGQRRPRTARLDADALPDWFVQTENRILTAQNAGNGAFGNLQRSFEVLQALGDICVGDFDGDETPDLAYTTENGLRASGWYANAGAGPFGEAHELAEPAEFYLAIKNADLDGDGDHDLVQATYQHIVWRANDGQGNFDDQILIANLPFLHQIVDLDGDGDLDLVASDFANFVQAYGYVNDGSGHFTPGFSLPATFVDYWCFFGDVDGDSDADLITLSENGDMFLYLNDGTGNFTGQQFVGQDGDYARAGITLTDMDDDGDPDILSPQSFGLRWFENQGGGAFDPNPHAIEASPQFFGYAVPLDADRDGDNDVLAASSDDLNSTASSFFAYYENTGDGVFAEPVYFGEYADCRRSIIPHDLDDDGDLDFAWFSPYAIGWWENLNGEPYISGACFWDKNENKIWDAGEPPVTGVKLRLTPSALLTYTTTEGEFRFFVPSGEYTLTFDSHDCWTLTTDSAEYHITAVDTTLGGYRFGFKKSTGARYVQPVIAGSFPRCNTHVPYWITLHNRTCNEAAGRVALVLDENVDFDSALPLPSAITGDTLWWAFDTIQPFAVGQIQLRLKITGLAGDSIHLQAFTWLDEPDGTFTFSESAFYVDEIRCSFDPNDKMVNRPVVAPGYVPAENELIYTIRFQNTGNDTAFLVRLRDTLSADLDWASLRPLGASHPYYPLFNTETGVLQFVFENIMLPDSATNGPGSQGFVQFSILLKPGLPPGSVVPNAVGIYFDANPVVATNTAETRVLLPLPVTEAVALPAARVYPNPTTGRCALLLDRATRQAADLQVFDLRGKAVARAVVPAGLSRQELWLPDLPAGLYLFRLEQPQERPLVGKFIKQ